MPRPRAQSLEAGEQWVADFTASVACERLASNAGVVGDLALATTLLSSKHSNVERDALVRLHGAAYSGSPDALQRSLRALAPMVLARDSGAV